MQRWTAAPDSAALKCISRKILPSCVSVIFRKKRRKGLLRQSLERIVKPERLRQRDAEQREEKQIIKIQDNGQHQRKQGVQTRQRVGNGSKQLQFQSQAVCRRYPRYAPHTAAEPLPAYQRVYRGHGRRDTAI